MREIEENSFFRLEPEIKDDNFFSSGLGNNDTDSDVDAIQFGLAAITMIVAAIFIFALVK